MEWMAWSWCIITSLFTYIRCRDRDLGEKWSLSKIFPKYASLDVYLKINHGSDKAEHSYHLAGPMQGWKAWSHVFSYFQCYCIHCIPWLLPLGGELHHLCFHVTIRPCLSSWFLYSLSLSLSPLMKFESRVLDWLTSVALLASCKMTFISWIPLQHCWINNK